MMFNASYKIARVWGIPIKIHVSLLIMVIFIVTDYGWKDGLLLELGLATSIVLHELGHSLVAIRKGCRVRQITLMFMGGVAQMDRLPKRPLDEFLVAAAGPAVSFLLAVPLLFFGFFSSLEIPPLLHRLLVRLGVVNLGLLLFNLLPSFPMDGGRILRAILTPKLGRLKATRIAARLGQFVAVLFILVGFRSSWVLVAIGFFIFMSAGNEYRMVRMEESERQHRFVWPFFAPSADSHAPPDISDKVVISPPPYEKGPPQESDIEAGDGNFDGFR